MNTCIVCLGEEDNDDLIEYNHCGLYHIHKDCLNKWKRNECIICREKIISNSDEDLTFNCKICIVISTLSPVLSTLVILLIFLI